MVVWSLLACTSTPPAPAVPSPPVEDVDDTGDTAIVTLDSGSEAPDSGIGPGTTDDHCNGPGDRAGVVSVWGPWNVASFTDLQAALDEATPGARVTMCPGTWVGAFVAPVPIVLEGVAGADRTLLDGGATGTTLTVAPGTSVTGLTLRGGAGTLGGGLAVSAPGELLVQDCRIIDNTATWGGGVWLPAGLAVIADTEISANRATGSGGGLYGSPGAIVDLVGATVDGNFSTEGGGVALESAVAIGGRVSGNDASANGGGMRIEGASAVVGTEIVGNTAPSGGGVATAGGTTTLTDVTLSGNEATGSGGGLYASGSTVVLDGGTVVELNSAEWGGGALVAGGELHGGEYRSNTATAGGGVSVTVAELHDAYVHHNVATTGGGVEIDGEGRILDSVVSDNSADHGGGVAGSWMPAGYHYGPLDVVGSTVERNVAVEDGGGIHGLGDGGTLWVSDTTVRDNGAARGAGIFAGDGLVVQIRESAIEANLASAFGGGLNTETSSAYAVDVVLTDWGSAGADNVPDDLCVLGTSYTGYEDDETFGCGREPCTPAP